MPWTALSGDDVVGVDVGAFRVGCVMGLVTFSNVSVTPLIWSNTPAWAVDQKAKTKTNNIIRFMASSFSVSEAIDQAGHESMA